MGAADYKRGATVFLDRDGVINRKAPEGEYVWRSGHFHLLDGVVEAIAELNRAHIGVYIASNQRGVSLGLYTEADVRRLHLELTAVLARAGGHVDGFYFCPHAPESCECRKPLPGLFQQAQAEHPEIDFAWSTMVGDSLSDIVAGQRLGMRTVLIDREETGQKAGAAQARALANFTYSSLHAALPQLLTQPELRP